jgi:hypothetical protein
VDALCAQIMRRKPRKAAKATDDERALIVCLSDWQLGKGEGGGTPATVERITKAFDGVVDRISELRRLGRGPGVVYLVGMGDLVEQCDGHYPMQAFSTDLDRREQKRVARRLILRLVDMVAPLAERVVLAAVPGNHGENRNGSGKAYTTWTDNDDLAVVEEVGEILAANPDRYHNVTTFTAPELTMTLDVAGVPVAFAHGHQKKGGGHAAPALEDWWRGQVMGRQGVADAQLLVTGHRHHLIVSEATGRTFLQCPAMDGGSAWYTAQTGNHSPSGVLTFGVGAAYGQRGWGDLAVVG